MLIRQMISTTTTGKSGIRSFPDFFDNNYDQLLPSLWSFTELRVTDRDRSQCYLGRPEWPSVSSVDT